MTGTVRKLKLIYVVDEERFVLYDLENDPGELVDVFPERGDQVAEWCRRLESIGALAAQRGGQEVDEDVKRDLEALGYAR